MNILYLCDRLSDSPLGISLSPSYFQRGLALVLVLHFPPGKVYTFTREHEKMNSEACGSGLNLHPVIELVV